MLRTFTPQSTDGFWPSAEQPGIRVRRLGWRRIVLAVRSQVALMAHQRELRRAERQLESLDDHMLKDFGIGRSEIGRAVRYGRGQ